MRGKSFTLPVLLGVIVLCGAGCRIPILMCPIIGEWEIKASDDGWLGQAGDTITFLSIGRVSRGSRDFTYYYSRVFRTLSIDYNISINFNGVVSDVVDDFDVEFYWNGLFRTGAKLKNQYGETVELELKSTPILRL